jgi:outer membrane protein W
MIIRFLRNCVLSEKNTLTTDLPKLVARSICIAILAMFANLAPAYSQDFDPTWRLHVDFAVVDPSGNFVVADVDGAGVQVGFDTVVGAGLRGEYQFSELLGVELGALGAGSAGVKTGVFGDLIGTAVGVSSFGSFTVGLNFHLAPNSSLDLYAGPFLAVVNYGNVDVQAGLGGVTTGESVDSDVSWGAIAGLDVPIGGRGWSFQTSLRYIDTKMTSGSDSLSFNSDFDPVVFSLGIGYRF